MKQSTILAFAQKNWETPQKYEVKIYGLWAQYQTLK
jgi:hypothetical protein